MTMYRIPSESAKKTWPCSVCGDETQPKTQMVAKRVTFTTLGSGYDVLRSRTTHYLCPKCREKDAEWLSPPFSGPVVFDEKSA